MLSKVLLVVLLADQCVGGIERTLYVSDRELITKYCGIDMNMPISANNNPVCENGSCYNSFDHALANVKSNDVINITTNSTLSFHNILKGLENVSIIGYNNPTVYCYNTSVIVGALKFNSCTNCIIQGITWSGCGGIINDIDYPVLEFYNSSNVTIKSCIFRQSKGKVITLSHMVGDAAINNSDFLQNVYLGSHGGAVIHFGNPQINFTITNCNFINNSGTESIININSQSNNESFGNISLFNSIFTNNKGSAIYLNHQDLYLYGEFHFNKSTAENGAAMFITSDSHVYFDQESSVEFHQNTVSDSGGAIYLSNDSTILLGRTSKFINNQARNNGGAITLHYNSLINSNFSVLFRNNNATHSGGAIYINHYCNVTLGYNSTFINNTADNGGAMALYDNCGITNAEHTKTALSFKGNTALQSGGALYLSMFSQTSFIQNAEVNFDENSAADSSYGGAIFSEFYSNVSFRGNSVVAFSNNSPPDGTLYSKNTSYVRHHANVTFNNNSMAQWYYGDEYTESNDIIINADGVVRCSDYREYYICSKNDMIMCSCKHIMNVTSYSEVTITDDLNISSPIILGGLDSVCLTGHNNATIHYKETGELKFMSCQNVNITDLTWNRPSNSENNPILRITFSNVSNIIVRNCSFQYSMGQAISLSNVSKYVNITYCKFIYNSNNEFMDNSNNALIHYLPGCTNNNNNNNVLTISNCTFSYNEYTQHGLIFLKPSKANCDNVVLRDSEFSNNDGTCIHGTKQNISIKGIVTFKNNEAYGSAGILITSNSTVTFCSNSTVKFELNQANTNGGAVSLSNYSVMIFESHSHLIFSNNKAMLGGAIYSTLNSCIILEEDSTIELLRNGATQNGGAIYSKTNCMISLKGNSSFSSNTAIEGGAIYSKDNSDLKIQNNAYVVFQGNEALISNGRDGNGGALYLDNYCSITFEGNSRVIFNKSIAYIGNGGAIYCNRSEISFMDRCHVTFDDNEVYNGYGGAIFFDHESDAKFQGMSMIMFKNSRATNGGALHFQCKSKVRFENNSLVNFSNNMATSGGAINFKTDTEGIFGVAKLLFCNNTATSRGGAVYLDNNVSLIFEKVFDSINKMRDLTCTDKVFANSSYNYIFYQNRAETGGAVSLEKSKIEFDNNSIIFNGNSASQDGGGIYLGDQSNITFINDCNVKFSNNSADDYGGAIYGKFATEMGQSTINFNSTNIVFENNDARIAGDSVYVNVPKNAQATV